LAELRHLAPPAPRPPVLRVALIHHPIHVFDANLGDRLTNSVVVNRRRTAEALGSAGVHLLLAGHRHRMNPAARARLDLRTDEQRPLGDRLGQLAGESPTVSGSEGRATAGALSVYRVLLDETDQRLSVDRLRYTFDRTGTSRATDPGVLRGIPFP
jgi:hypothetical protein